MFFSRNLREKWHEFCKEVNAFDKKITDTNPFSEVNYSRKTYKNFRDFYQPRPEHVVVWVDEE